MLIAKLKGIAAALIAFIAVSAGFGTLVGQDQPAAQSPPEKPTPRFPDAVTEAPDWLGPEAPFDVARFFEAPPPEENAAPLYLDAFLEFSDDVAVCFPESEERAHRAERAKERDEAYLELIEAMQEDPESVTDAQIDAIIDRYQVGFRKLAEAQARPRCVFQTNIQLDKMDPHIPSVRQVARVEMLRVRRALDRGEMDEAIASIGRSLRLSRDIQPRGGTITQLVSTSVEEYAVFRMMLQPILANSALRLEDCDRLIQILTDHESQAIDGYAESRRAEYIENIATLRDLTMHQDELKRRFEAEIAEHGWWSFRAKIAERSGSVVWAIIEPLLEWELPDRPVGDLRARLEPWPKDGDARIAKTTPEELSRQVKKLSDYYRGLLDLAALPYLERVPKAADLRENLRGDDLLSLVVEALPSKVVEDALTDAMTHLEATRRAMPALVALRRWQLVHGESPTDLAAALKEAGIPTVPIDPYDGEPFRLSTIDGEPVLYAIGPDGKDDGAREEARGGRGPGDVIFGTRPKER